MPSQASAAAAPLVSVIVPVYRAERFLPGCAESILGQSWRNLELILVEDGSPDGCAALCDALAARDGRVRVLHQPNGGVSRARNAGLAAAKGEYLCFVDADDQLAPCTIAAALAAQAQHPEALIYWAFTKEAAAFAAVCAGGQPEPEPPVPNAGVAAMHMAGELCTPCTRLYRRAVLAEAGLQFAPDVALGEDMDFSLSYLLALHRRWPDFALVRFAAPLYYYEQGNDSSLTHSRGAGYCAREIELFERLRAVCAAPFGAPEPELARIDLHYLRTMADGIAGLAEADEAAARAMLARPELRALCARLHAAGGYSLFLGPVRRQSLGAVRRVARLREAHFRQYQRLYWAGWWLRRLAGKPPCEVFF